MVAVDVDLKPLVPQARTGNPEAWDQLFQRYQAPLYSYVYELVRDEQSSLDIVQETFISACRHLGSLREDGKFGSWLFGIAHQKCIQYWRRHRRDQERRQEQFPEDLPAQGADPAEWLIRQEQEEAFLRLVKELPEGQRSVLLLRFIEEFSIDDIASITGLPPGTVKSRLHYAKHALRHLFEEEP